MVTNEATRNLSYLYGYPKRFTLLLDDDSREQIIVEIQLDELVAGSHLLFVPFLVGL